ncbi:MAG: hypothetical protein PHV74_15200 [Dehalococcoidia bacterium]|nr:hypothetical protein [Dehalococcoidia bacterium]
MDDKKKAKLERYLRNADSFLWGVGPADQADSKKTTQETTYDWLRGRGMEFKSGPYPFVLEQLLADPGIEKLIEDVIKPRVKDLFGPKVLDYMRECWMAGTVPDSAILIRYNLKNGEPFFKRQLLRGAKWKELAWVWFEEIEDFSE